MELENFDILFTDEAINEPFKDYIDSDKSMYAKASETINPRTGRFYVDLDNDFLVGNSGGFLLNIDFTFCNTELIKEAGNTYDKYKKHTFHEVDSIDYDKFVEREEYRREHGFTAPCKKLKDGTVVDLNITGEHYNFINYGHIEKLDRTTINILGQQPKKVWGIPENFDSQYWVFKIKKFCKVNGFNLIILKSRRKGMSFIEGVGSANIVNLIPNSKVIHAAYDTKFLTKAGAITDMSKKQLYFYEFNTPFVRGSLDDKGKSRGLLKKEITELKTGYKDAHNNDAGDQSVIFTVPTSQSADVAAGKSAIEIKCDELNTFPNFTEFLKMTNPTTTTGAFKTGIIIAFGTGGTKEGNWIEFERHFFNTSTYDFMPFENVWDENSRDEVTGLFLPYWWGLEGLDTENNFTMDKDGNTIYHLAIKVSNEERRFKFKTFGKTDDFISHCSQYCNRIGEAFNSGTTKFLSSLELKEHIKNVKTKKEYKLYSDGWILEDNGKVKFVSNVQLESDGYKTHKYIEDVPFKSTTDTHGCIRILHFPFYTEEGIIPENLYFTVYDTYAAEKEKDEITTKHSLASVQVWMYPNNITYSSGKILCASWTGRLSTPEEADIVAFNMTKLYNGMLLPEVDRGTVIASAKKFKFLHKILPDPTLVNKNDESKKRSYGMVIGNTARKLDGILMLKQFLYEPISNTEDELLIRRFETITDLPTLLEYDMYSNKGNFDRTSCSILAVYQMNAYTTMNMKAIIKHKSGRLADIINKRK